MGILSRSEFQRNLADFAHRANRTAELWSDVWCFANDPDEAECRDGWPLLSASEREIAQRFHFELHRRRYIGGHAALRQVLAAYTGVPPQELSFRNGSHGKPSLAWPEIRLSFNLSHSAHAAAIVVANGAAAGVDVEEIRGDRSCEDISRRFFSPAENRWLDSAPDSDRTLHFFRLWTVKEAVVKANGQGLSIPLDAVEVTFAHDGSVAIDCGPPPSGTSWWVRELDLRPTHAGAVALDQPHELRIIA